MNSTVGEDYLDDDEEDDEYLCSLHVKKSVSEESCPNLIKWWLNCQTEYLTLSWMALDYLIIPSMLSYLHHMIVTDIVCFRYVC